MVLREAPRQVSGAKQGTKNLHFASAGEVERFVPGDAIVSPHSALRTLALSVILLPVSNRWLRFVIALLAMGAAGAAGYRIFQQEQRLARDVASTRGAEQAAESAIVTISELKAALHAYVAAGQGQAFWTARAAMLLDKLRATVLELDGTASTAGASLTDALDLSDRLAASEQRARDHVRAGQALLAGDVIFTEARDLLDAMRIQVARARDRIGQAAGTRVAEIRREQTMLAMGALGVLAFALLLLVIPGGSQATSAGTAVSADSAPSAPLSEAAAVCTDLGRVSQSVEISALLDRAASVLTASGIIVWMSSDNRDQLFPVASSGYDERMIARIGSILRMDDNLTAAAFRDGAARTSAGLGPSAAALAVPLLTPHGPVGVFSAELRDVAEVDADRLALATIFAAQLSTLLGSMASTPAEAPSAQQAQG